MPRVTFLNYDIRVHVLAFRVLKPPQNCGPMLALPIGSLFTAASLGMWKESRSPLRDHNKAHTPRGLKWIVRMSVFFLYLE